MFLITLQKLVEQKKNFNTLWPLSSSTVALGGAFPFLAFTLSNPDFLLTKKIAIHAPDYGIRKLFSSFGHISSPWHVYYVAKKGCIKTWPLEHQRKQQLGESLGSGPFMGPGRQFVSNHRLWSFGNHLHVVVNTSLTFLMVKWWRFCPIIWQKSDNDLNTICCWVPILLLDDREKRTRSRLLLAS